MRCHRLDHGHSSRGRTRVKILELIVRALARHSKTEEEQGLGVLVWDDDRYEIAPQEVKSTDEESRGAIWSSK